MRVCVVLQTRTREPAPRRTAGSPEQLRAGGSHRRLRNLQITASAPSCNRPASPADPAHPWVSPLQLLVLSPDLRRGGGLSPWSAAECRVYPLLLLGTQADDPHPWALEGQKSPRNAGLAVPSAGRRLPGHTARLALWVHAAGALWQRRQPRLRRLLPALSQSVQI